MRNFKLLKFGNLVERNVCFLVHLVAIGQFPIPLNLLAHYIIWFLELTCIIVTISGSDSENYN